MGKVDSQRGWRLYLDFDGVLNNDAFLRHQRNHLAPGEWRLFDPANVAALDLLCARLPVVEIVVSSSWKVGREVEELVGLLAREGARCAGLVRDVTSCRGSSPEHRAREITDHAASCPISYLALDDMDLSGWLADGRFYRVSGAVGLTSRDVVAIDQAWRQLASSSIGSTSE